VQIDTTRSHALAKTRDKILDVAREVLGENPEAGMGDIASAAGVVRRTVYGHFPSRGDLVRSLTQQAAEEITAVLAEVDSADAAADAAWVDFVARLWPLAHRYRVLVALRRGEYGDEIHALLGPVDTALAMLVQRGQDRGVFARHLPAAILGQLAFAAVFSIAGNESSAGGLGARAASITVLLMLGVPEPRALALANEHPPD
jgi:AcrR family transcriptional regulator